jgi:cyclophilin family peptidyl-prolyl cis-trans isomerase
VLAQTKADYLEDIRVVYRHFPLVSIHDKALLATQASEAAGLQGLFWEMHDYLYQNQAVWSALSVGDFQDWLVNTAAIEISMSPEEFATDLTSAGVVAYANETWEFGQQIGLPGTPFFVLNGAPYQGPIDSASIGAIIGLTKMQEIQYTECPPIVIDPLKQYIATIELAAGSVEIELFPDVAPLTVNSFVFLAQNGWFDGVTFHRVLPGFVAQAGDPSSSGMGGPGYAFKHEISPDLSFAREGLLAMANSGLDTNGSQFFITYAATPQLNGNYTIFGEVRSGMDVVRGITPRDPSQGGSLPAGDEIISITIEEK